MGEEIKKQKTLPLTRRMIWMLKIAAQNAPHIVTDHATLRGLARRGYIELHDHTLKRVTHPLHIEVTAYYVEDVCREKSAEFTKETGLALFSKYLDGTLMPYVGCYQYDQQ
jgi:hypothetical protein